MYTSKFTSEITLAAGGAAAAGPNVGLPAQIGYHHGGVHGVQLGATKMGHPYLPYFRIF